MKKLGWAIVMLVIVYLILAISDVDNNLRYRIEKNKRTYKGYIFPSTIFVSPVINVRSKNFDSELDKLDNLMDFELGESAEITIKVPEFKKWEVSMTGVVLNSPEKLIVKVNDKTVFNNYLPDAWDTGVFSAFKQTYFAREFDVPLKNLHYGRNVILLNSGLLKEKEIVIITK
jgi:hypothetical protein